VSDNRPGAKTGFRGANVSTIPLDLERMDTFTQCLLNTVVEHHRVPSMIKNAPQLPTELGSNTPSIDLSN
jgi:hypothetical protein